MVGLSAARTASRFTALWLLLALNPETEHPLDEPQPGKICASPLDPGNWPRRCASKWLRIVCTVAHPRELATSPCKQPGTGQKTREGPASPRLRRCLAGNASTGGGSAATIGCGCAGLAIPIRTAVIAAQCRFAPKVAVMGTPAASSALWSSHSWMKLSTYAPRANPTKRDRMVEGVKLLSRESREAQARIAASEREMWSQRSCMQSTPAVLKAARNCTQQVRTESAPMLKPEPASTLLPQRSAMTEGHSA